MRERKSYIAGLGAATAVATVALKPAGKRGTLMRQGVRTEVLIFPGWEPGSLCLFGYASIKEPVAPMVARITVSLIGVEVV